MANGFNKIIKSFVFLLVVSMLLVFLNGVGYLEKPNGAVSFLYTPIVNTFQGYSNDTGNIFRTIESISSFKEENSRLKKENYQLLERIAILNETERENEILRRQLDFSDKLCAAGTCLDWMMAKVIARSPNSYEKYIIIDQGKKVGIRENQAAIFSGGIMIGKIVQVYDNTSKVLLLSSSDSSVNVITETSRSNGVVRGKFSIGVRLEMINQNEELKEEELIITSGLEDGVPKGLLIGKTMDIEESANKIFKEANVGLFVDFNSVEEVFIVK